MGWAREREAQLEKHTNNREAIIGDVFRPYGLISSTRHGFEIVTFLKFGFVTPDFPNSTI